ncbi:MAG: hypothetical protein Q9201_000366 [Fulgogasparrea decipioides]
MDLYPRTRSETLVAYNPSLKADCSGLKSGTAYCVEENYGNGPATPSSTSSTSSTTSSPTTITQIPTGPSPVQSGINPQCTHFYKVESGDTCAGIVDKYHTFTLGDFYSWNPAVGQNCETLFAGYYVGLSHPPLTINRAHCLQVCVGIPETPTVPPTTTTVGATPGPSPTQSGLVSNCMCRCPRYTHDSLQYIHITQPDRAHPYAVWDHINLDTYHTDQYKHHNDNVQVSDADAQWTAAAATGDRLELQQVLPGQKWR